LATTLPHFGGVRWWFVCPLICNGSAEKTKGRENQRGKPKGTQLFFGAALARVRPRGGFARPLGEDFAKEQKASESQGSIRLIGSQ
jgi:hypothetical protein